MLTFNPATRTPDQFFGDLSQSVGRRTGYNKGFDVDLVVKSGTTPEYVIREWDKTYFSRFMTFTPDTPEGKIKTAVNLAGLVDKYASTIAKNNNIPTIIERFGKFAKTAVEGTTPAQAKTISDSYKKAIATLSRAKLTQDLEGFSTSRGGFKLQNALEPGTFYTQFSRTGFWRGFNKRMFVIQPSQGEFEIHTTGKPGMFKRVYQTFFGKALPAAQKIATVENLAAMVDMDRNFIRSQRFDVKGMVANVNTLKAKITRHTTPEQESRIKFCLGHVITQLNAIGLLIAQDRNNDLSKRVGRFVRDWVAKPMWSYGVKMPIKLTWNITKFATNTTINWGIFPALTATKAVTKGTWNLATFTTRTTLNWTVVPVANVFITAITWPFSYLFSSKTTP